MSDISTVCCPVCGADLKVKFSTSKRGKVSLSLACPNDGRHFRGFINDPAFVRGVVDSLEYLEGHTPSSDDRVDGEDNLVGNAPSKMVLEGPTA